MEVALGHRHSREIAGRRSGHKMTHKVGGGGGLGGEGARSGSLADVQ